MIHWLILNVKMASTFGIYLGAVAGRCSNSFDKAAAIFSFRRSPRATRLT
jgi:hypothetical protein